MINASFATVMLLSIIVWFVYRFFLYIKTKKINILRECLLLLFLIYFLVLLLITVFKAGMISFNNPLNGYLYKNNGIFGIINIIPFKETIATLTNNNVPIMNPIRNIVGNILLFIPLGFIIPMLFNKYNNLLKVFVLGFISSLSIEVVQLFVGYNVSDIDDIIFNTTGAVLGFLCYKILIKLVSNKKFNKLLEKISDFETENLLPKTLKYLSAISILIAIVYTYCIFDQTASDKLSNEELLTKVFKENTGDFVQSIDLEDRKLYLIKYDDGLDTKILTKYGKSRYVDPYESFGYYNGNNVGYTVGVIHNLDTTTNKLSISIAVFGKNNDADKLSIRLGEKTYDFDLKNNDYFLSVYPEYVEIDDELMDDIYNGVNNKYFEVKFLKNNGVVVKDMKFVK